MIICIRLTSTIVIAFHEHLTPSIWLGQYKAHIQAKNRCQSLKYADIANNLNQNTKCLLIQKVWEYAAKVTKCFKQLAQW